MHARNETKAMAFHRALPDSAFKIDFRDIPAGTLPGARLRLANADTFPILGAPDVQSSLIKVRIEAGNVPFENRHPGGAELTFILQGKLEFTLRFRSPHRIVRNTFKKGQAAVIPKNVFHDVKCLSQFDCLALVLFNVVDPGSVEA